MCLQKHFMYKPSRGLLSLSLLSCITRKMTPSIAQGFLMQKTLPSIYKQNTQERTRHGPDLLQLWLWRVGGRSVFVLCTENTACFSNYEPFRRGFFAGVTLAWDLNQYRSFAWLAGSEKKKTLSCISLTIIGLVSSVKGDWYVRLDKHDNLSRTSWATQHFGFTSNCLIHGEDDT